MREYLLRHHDPERRKSAPKRLLEIMPETYGVMVYQEDVIKVAHLYAGLTLAERKRVPGIAPARADVIVAGGYVVLAVLERLGASTLQVSDRGVRWGLAQALLG